MFKYNGPWLLVYDNIVTQDWLDSKLKYRKQNNGHILVTSRLALRGERIKVGPFHENESINCMRDVIRKFNPDYVHGVNEYELKAIIGKLQNLPLALVQAAAYIATEEIELSDYITRFDDKNEELLNYNDFSIPRSFYATFSLSFNGLGDEEKEVLFMLSYLFPDGILMSFFGSESKNAFIKLRNYSLVDIDGERISIHRLLQLVGREKSKTEKNCLINNLLLQFEHFLDTQCSKDKKDFFNVPFGDIKSLAFKRREGIMKS